MLERNYQAGLIKRIEDRFPGCFVIKLPTDAIQGLPDLLVLYGRRWAMLEDKAHATARRRPNQSYYVELFDEMSFAAFIYPENEEEVLNELEHAFDISR